MKKIYSTFVILVTLVAALGVSSCSKDSDNTGKNSNAYDVIVINGEKYACFGYRSIVTYRSTWDLARNSGSIVLPCGEISDAERGNFNYAYMYSIYLEGSQPLQRGSKLENYSPTLDTNIGWSHCEYLSGSATITDKKDDKYITIIFDSFTFSNGNKYYSFDGTVQIKFESHLTSTI